MKTLKQEAIEVIASELQQWGNEATFEMQRLLDLRVKEKDKAANSLRASINFESAVSITNGTRAEWTLNDYYVYIDLGVKGVQNRSKTYGTFAFKNMHVSKGFLKSLESYITRKGKEIPEGKGSVLERRKSLAYLMGKAIKRKGIDGTRFYSDVFNEAAFQKLANRIAEKLGQYYEIKITADLK
jgi:hypothetical protein